MTKPIKDELLEIDDEGKLYESGFYWKDENHSGTIFISQKMVDKYKLEDDSDPIEEFFNDNDWSVEDREQYKNYTHSLFISHCAYWSKTKEEEVDRCSSYTPHGDTYSEEFVMWWNELPLELLSEPEEDVNVFGWKDG